MTPKEIFQYLALHNPHVPLRLCIEAAQHGTTVDEATEYLKTHTTIQLKIEEVFKNNG